MKALLYLPNCWLVVNSDIDRLHLYIFARIEALGGMFHGGRRDEHYASEARKRAKRGKRKTERDERGSPGRIFYSWNIF